MIFELDNVELFYFNKQLLNGIYLKAETAKITGILGRNGDGKSSLLQIFFGNLNPRHKLIRIDGKPYLKPFFSSKNVKFLPQDSFIPSFLTLQKAFEANNVEWELFIKDFPEFKEFENTKIRNFSGGEQRVIEIFLIVKSSSKIVLLDEPFTHLAPAKVERFKEIFQTEKTKKAIVVTDHRYRHVMDLADDLYLLKNGCSQLITDLKQLEDYRYLNPDTL